MEINDFVDELINRILSHKLHATQKLKRMHVQKQGTAQWTIQRGGLHPVHFETCQVLTYADEKSTPVLRPAEANSHIIRKPPKILIFMNVGKRQSSPLSGFPGNPTDHVN